MKSIFLLAILMTTTTFAKEVALTIDDAPRENENIFSGTERTKKLIEILKRRKIQSVFFCNSAKLEEADGRERIELYAQAGQYIANHTHSHPRLDDVPVEDYLREIDTADEILRHFSTFKKWFRYPFLNEGKSPDVKERVRNHLKNQGYFNGYVTVDNYDYLINDLVQRAIQEKRKVHVDRACDMLIDISIDGLEYQNGLKKQQPVRQVLLMHENDLEALCMDKLIDRLEEKGWKIVSPDLTFQTPGFTPHPIQSRTISSLTQEFDHRNIVENKLGH